MDEGSASRRVLEWARTRYVDVVMVPVDEFDTEGFARFTAALREAANRLGDIAPIDIVRFGEYVREMKARDQEEAA